MDLATYLSSSCFPVMEEWLESTYCLQNSHLFLCPGSLLSAKITDAWAQLSGDVDLACPTVSELRTLLPEASHVALVTVL